MRWLLTRLGEFNGLTTRYVLALSLVACVIIGSYLVLTNRIAQNLDDAYVINTAGMQRMLSQRIGLMAREVVSARTDADAQLFAAKLARALARIKANHAELTSNASREFMTPAVAALYNSDQGVSARMSDFTAYADNFLRTYRLQGRDDARTEALMLAIVQIARNGFLDDLDAVVKQYERDFNEEFSAFMQLEALFVVLALVLLVIEALLIFRPMVTTINRQMLSLRESNAELREFTFRISHDLRAPIASSLGMVRIARDACMEGDKETVEFTVDRIEDSMIRLDALIEDIINVSRPRHKAVKTELLSLTNVVDEVLNKLSGMPGYESMIVTTDIEVAEPINTQRLYLEQILENLVSNAIKYADAGKAHQELAIVARRCERNRYEIVISDNGIGVPDKCREDLFGMFQRFHPKQSYGSGLGLYLVQQNATVIGGDVSYEPLPEGSQFTVRFAA